MPIVVIIPVKSFRLGNQRLADAVDERSRARLGKALADHVADTVSSVGLVPLVVTADPEVAEWSTRAGFPSLADPAQGLDAAADTGVDWALSTGSRWIVLHSDLPLVGPSDIEALTGPVSEGGSVIAPSADGGTSAIGSEAPVQFSFGVSSFHRHLLRMTNPRVVARTGLLLDVDSPRDLESAMATRRGAWLEEALR
ncbi:MAG: 2-phospho-L-lactate guanylyltransferase [Acidimicrobiia bacterium]